MNSAALKSAWTTSSSQPASAASEVPAPKSTIMKPSWLTVPNASMSFRSFWRSAWTPPARIVTLPTTNTIGRHSDAVANTGARRATR